MQNNMILAIDPGNIDSAYVVLGKDLKPVEFGKVNNEILKDRLEKIYINYEIDYTIIEMVACYGMAVGKEVFETCVWIGRFHEVSLRFSVDVKFIYRKDEKINLCNSMKAKDSNIRQALIDRFAKHDFKNGKGMKKNPDWFYGFKADIWAAYAVGVTYYDMHLNKD